MKKELSEDYKGCQIKATEEVLKDENGKDYKFIQWFVTKMGKLVLSDIRTIDGNKLQSVNHAVNDAKKNIETIYRLANDGKKYKRWIKRNPLEYKRRMDEHRVYHKRLCRKVMASKTQVIVQQPTFGGFMQAAQKLLIINHCHGLHKTACCAVVAGKLNEMTFEEALTAQIGDILVCGYTTTNYKADDEVILVERARDINEIPKDTGGWFYHRSTKKCFGANIQDFNFKKKDPHEVSKVKCDLCGKEWIAVRPEGLTKLECPNCENMVQFENV